MVPLWPQSTKIIAATTTAGAVPVWLQSTGIIATAVGVLIALYVAVWREPRKARDEREARNTQATEDRTRYETQIAALQRAENDRIAAQARRIVPEITRSAFFGENVWLGHIQNASTGAISELRVVVTARDNDGNEVVDGFRKATGELDISGGLQRMVSGALSGGIGGALGSNPLTRGLGQLPRDAIVQQIAPEVSRQLQIGLMGQLQKDWPTSLGPNASTSVAYRATRPDLRLHIGIRFEDEAGYEWDRVNQDQPKRVDPAD